MTTIKTADQLAQVGLVNPDTLAALAPVLAEYAVAISPAMTDLIHAEQGNGPISRQFLPDIAETITLAEELADPIGDHPHSPVKGIVHRCADRVLLKPVHHCAVYCRFCFRREQVGPGKEFLSAAELDNALDYIRQNAAIWEVILTGGDPMVMSDRRLKDLCQKLAAIPHVGVIRFHTRVPVVAPERITASLVRALKTTKPVYIAIHTNHADEWTPAARTAAARLADAGLPLLSQTVLLKGINDTLPAMTRLMRTLVENRVKPYYLHHADLAKGTSHFRTDIATGQNLMMALREAASGLCQPTYVLDIPGGHGKIPVTPAPIEQQAAGQYRLTDPKGRIHDYQA